MRQLTINQLMALLAIARGTLENELTCGTRTRDIQQLGRLGLVVRRTNQGSTYDTTERGNSLIEALKTVSGELAFNAADDVVVDGGIVNLMAPIIDAALMGRGTIPGPLSRFASMVHGDFQVEADDGRGLQLSDVEGSTARVNGGTFFLVAEAGVEILPSAEGSDADFSGVRVQKVDTLVHSTEQQATDVAVERAKAQVGSRHVVLKAVAMHEVAVPIKSTRL